MYNINEIWFKQVELYSKNFTLAIDFQISSLQGCVLKLTQVED